jgi:hypothetical protein
LVHQRVQGSIGKLDTEIDQEAERHEVRKVTPCMWDTAVESYRR